MARPIDHQQPQNQRTSARQTPKRISITIPYGTYQKLLGRSDQEGRSLSNLAAFLLETGTACQAKQTDHAA